MPIEIEGITCPQCGSNAWHREEDLHWVSQVRAPRPTVVMCFKCMDWFDYGSGKVRRIPEPLPPEAAFPARKRRGR